MLYWCDQLRQFKSEKARRAAGDRGDEVTDQQLDGLIRDAELRIARETFTAYTEALQTHEGLEDRVDEATSAVSATLAAQSRHVVDLTEAERKRKRSKAHLDTTNVHLHSKYTERVEKLAAFDFPGERFDAILRDKKRKLGTEARGDRVGQRKAALVAAFEHAMVRDDSVVFSPMDAQGFNAASTERIADACDRIKANEPLDLPAIVRGDELYQHDHAQNLARRFGRQVIAAGSRGAWCGCLTTVRFRNRADAETNRKCGICDCVIWEWHVEHNKSFAHLGCALFAANSEPT